MIILYQNFYLNKALKLIKINQVLDDITKHVTEQMMLQKTCGN